MFCTGGYPADCRTTKPVITILSFGFQDYLKYRRRTRAGRALYALRKQTVEPVFGIIKGVMGVRQFLTRGLENVQNEWTRVCLAWNFKRMAVLRP